MVSHSKNHRHCKWLSDSCCWWTICCIQFLDSWKGARCSRRSISYWSKTVSVSQCLEARRLQNRNVWSDVQFWFSCSCPSELLTSIQHTSLIDSSRHLTSTPLLKPSIFTLAYTNNINLMDISPKKSNTASRRTKRRQQKQRRKFRAELENAIQPLSKQRGRLQSTDRETNPQPDHKIECASRPDQKVLLEARTLGETYRQIWFIANDN